MTFIESINFWFTCVSVVVTIISIFCSIGSYKSAKKAKQYKVETLNFKGTLDLCSLLDRFRSESQNYQNRTRKVDWYRGLDPNLVISPFNNILLSFGEYYHLMTDETAIGMKSKVHSLQMQIQNFSTFTHETQKEINMLITEITELLQKETRIGITNFVINA